MDELHDTFIQQDPLTGKTLLYIAGGFDSGFYVFDVSDPANPSGSASGTSRRSARTTGTRTRST